MKVKGFGNCKFLNFRSGYVTFLRNVRNGHFGKKNEEKQNNISSADDKYENCEKKQSQIAGIAVNTPSCNYFVATIVARLLQTTVKGGGQPSGLRRSQD